VSSTDSIALTVVFEQVEGGHYQASVPAVPGTITTGRTRAEARANVRDALRMILTTEPDAARVATDTEQIELRIGRTRPGGLDRDIDR
jgi:predicted RNase H-like HicB family nuclease